MVDCVKFYSATKESIYLAFYPSVTVTLLKNAQYQPDQLSHQETKLLFGNFLLKPLVGKIPPLSREILIPPEKMIPLKNSFRNLFTHVSLKHLHCVESLDYT